MPYTLEDIKEAFEEGFYEGAGDDAWYRDHPGADCELSSTAGVLAPLEEFIKELDARKQLAAENT